MPRGQSINATWRGDRGSLLTLEGAWRLDRGHPTPSPLSSCLTSHGTPRGYGLGFLTSCSLNRAARALTDNKGTGMVSCASDLGIPWRKVHAVSSVLWTQRWLSSVLGQACRQESSITSSWRCVLTGGGESSAPLCSGTVSSSEALRSPLPLWRCPSDSSGSSNWLHSFSA